MNTWSVCKRLPKGMLSPTIPVGWNIIKLRILRLMTMTKCFHECSSSVRTHKRVRFDSAHTWRWYCCYWKYCHLLEIMFNNDIRAIVPKISMSAGTMIAMSCKEIIMGNQLSWGPIDPQMGGVACKAVIDEFNKAVVEVKHNPASLGFWQSIIGNLTLHSWGFALMLWNGPRPLLPNGYRRWIPMLIFSF